MIAFFSAAETVTDGHGNKLSTRGRFQQQQFCRACVCEVEVAGVVLCVSGFHAFTSTTFTWPVLRCLVAMYG